MEQRSSEWPRYRLYGLTLASDFPFANRLPPSDGFPDLTFTRVTTSPPLSGGKRSDPAFASLPSSDGESLFYLYRQGNYDVLRYTDVADFYLWPDSIVCHLLDPAYDYAVEIYLLGLVLSFWLEKHGIPALHASAVSVAGRAVVFLATNEGGKSSLAAALMQAGYPLLTDDVLAIDNTGTGFVGRPGYPQMRMWPDQAEYFLGHYDDLEKVHPALSKCRVPVGLDGLGAFCEEPQPLACFYLPVRRGPEDGGTRVAVVPVSPRDGVIELVRRSFLPKIVWAAGLQPQRLKFFSQIARQIPIRRIVYQNGVGHLPDVRRAILEDVEAL